MLTACSSDEPAGPQTTVDDNSKVFASLTLKLPASNGARDNNGYEIGQDKENKVTSVLVLLATKNEKGEYVCFNQGETGNAQMMEPDATGRIACTLTFNANKLTPNPLDTLADGSSIIPKETVYVFTYINPTPSFRSQLNTALENDRVIDNIAVTVTDAENAELWRDNNFFMSNKSIVPITNFPTRDELIKNHSTQETAYPLGTVEVIRACARFDFATVNNNEYPIYGADKTTLMGTVRLTHMALFNEQNAYFTLPRVNTSWNWSNSAETTTKILCGDLEKYYVMSYNIGKFKNKAPLSTTDITTNYYYPLIQGGQNGSNLKWTSLSNWDSQTPDNDENWNPNQRDYRIWRYCTENTIPGVTGTSSQKIGITTGVAFRAEFEPADKELWDGNVIYFYKGICYGSYEKLAEYCAKYDTQEVATAFADAFNHPHEGQTVNHKTTNLLNGSNDDFKAFRPTWSDDTYSYRMYYFYYNRHNTNGVDTQMGINEFGVVRNNVYKLAVTNIKTFGRPDFPTPDEKDDPDEEEHAYFTVTCYVMPWTVRVNDIEF